MLLIMIDHKQPEQEQSGENAADNFDAEGSCAGQMKIPERSRNRNHQQKRRGKDDPPAFRRGIRRVRFRRQYEFFAGSHVR